MECQRRGEAGWHIGKVRDTDINAISVDCLAMQWLVFRLDKFEY